MSILQVAMEGLFNSFILAIFATILIYCIYKYVIIKRAIKLQAVI